MTTKTLTGAYPAGYALSASYTGLIIESASTVGGTGVSASAAASIANHGQVNATASNDGVLLGDGGSVTNGGAGDATALIAGYNGVLVQGASAAIVNFATISGTAFVGVSLTAGGTVTNGAAGSTTALIEGYGGVYASGPATVVNFGTIAVLGGDTGRRGEGVDLYGGGSVTNGGAGSTAALIEGYGGVFASGATATVVNFATIQGSRYGGVYLSAGGSVTNGSLADTKALIVADSAVYGRSAPLTLANFATISGSAQNGVDLQGGGGVTNGSALDRVAAIGGYFNGVYAFQTSISVANFGTIFGGHSNGVFLGAGGTVTNGSAADTTALIKGRTGLSVKGGPTTIVNFGAIKGLGGPGVYVGVGAKLINGSATDVSALISGHKGVYVKSGSATVTNFGTITGIGGAAVDFVSAGNMLIAEAGGVFNGAVLGGGGTLNLANGTGTITSLSGGDVTVTGSLPTTTFTNFGTVEIGKPARFILSGTGAIGAGGTVTLIDNGALTVTGGLSIAGGAVAGAGTLTIAGEITGAGRVGKGRLTLINAAAGLIDGGGAGVLTLDTGANTIVNDGVIKESGPGGVTVDGAVGGTGSARVNGGTLFFASSFSQNVGFGATGVLELADSQAYAGRIRGFSKTGGTALDLKDIAFRRPTKATYSGTATSGTLTVTDGIHTAQIKLVGDYLGSTFTLADDGHGGTTVTDSAKPAALAAPTHVFVAAMAAFHQPATAVAHLAHAWRQPQPFLSAPGIHFA